MRHQRYTVALCVAFALVVWGCSTPLKQAERLEQTGSYQDAITAYEQAIQADPNADAARQAQLKIAGIYRDKLKQPEEAIARYKQIAEAHPGTEEAAEGLYQAGVALMSAKKYEEAAGLLNQIIQNYTEHRQSHYAQLLLAKAYEESGKSEEASEVYASFARRSDDSRRSVQALISKAKLDREMGKQESATKALQDAIKQYGNDPEAQQELEKVKTELQEMGASVPKPDKVDAREKQRQARRERDRPRSSFYGSGSSQPGAQTRQYTNSFNVNPDAVMRDMQIQSDQQGTVYDAMFMVGNMFLSMEDYNSAGALFERGIQMAQDAGAKIEPQTYRKLAECYEKIGLQAKADETLRKAAKADPKVIDTIIESGNFEYQSGNYEKAIETYNSALGILPTKDAAVYYHLGLAYQKLGDADKELEYFERAVAASPNDKDAMQHLAEVLAYRKGNRPRAEIYQDLVDGRSSSYEMQKELADLCFKYKNYQWAKTKYTSAARIAERKIQREQDAAEIAKLQGQVLTGNVMAAVANAYRGKQEEAQAAFDSLAAENPDSPAIDLGQGYLALQAGDPDAAVAAFQASLTKDPGYGDAARALGGYYLSVGKKTEALAVWEEYIKHNRTDRDMWTRVRNLKKEIEASQTEESTEESVAPTEETPAENTPVEAAEEPVQP